MDQKGVKSTGQHGPIKSLRGFSSNNRLAANGAHHDLNGGSILKFGKNMLCGLYTYLVK
jgi:hypothetical protein